MGSTALDTDRPVFFCHIPRSGGTTLSDWVVGAVDDAESYPRPGDPFAQLVEKMFPQPLAALATERARRLRFISVHLPLCVQELVPVPTTSAVLVRDPVDQLRSSFAKQGLAVDPAALADGPDAYALRWYATNQLGWYLGADLDDVMGVFDQVDPASGADVGSVLPAALETAMRGRDLVGAACARLERVDLLGLAERRDPVVGPLARWLGVPTPDPGVRLNRTDGSDVAADVRADLEVALAAELEIFRYASRLVGA